MTCADVNELLCGGCLIGSCCTGKSCVGVSIVLTVHQSEVIGALFLGKCCNCGRDLAVFEVQGKFNLALITLYTEGGEELRLRFACIFEKIYDLRLVLNVECEVIKTTSNNTAVNKSDIIFNNPNFTSAAPIIHIIPQDVASLELYIDFTINEGTPQNPIPVQYQGFKIDVTAQELDEYVYNGKYNWSITIGTKNSISFEVIKVNEWIDGSTNNEFPLQ